MPQEVANTVLYNVKPQSPVRLTITVGDGNVGGSSVRFKGKTLADDSVTDLPIPPPEDPDQDLKAKTARCTTTVQRINRSSSHASVTYTLRGGVEDKTYTFETTLSQVGDLADFSTTIAFQ